MIEIPVYYAGKSAAFFELLRLIAVALCNQSVVSGSLEHILGIGAVPGNTAVGAHLLKRYPSAVICKNHSQRCGSALKRLHLHYNRHLCDTAGNRFFDYIPLTHILPQFNTNDIGEILSVTIDDSYIPAGISPDTSA